MSSGVTADGGRMLSDRNANPAITLYAADKIGPDLTLARPDKRQRVVVP